MKESLGLISVIFVFISLVPYIIDILLNKTKPHVFTWIIWAIVTIIAFLGQWQKGAGAGSWTTGVTGVLTTIIAILALRKGTKDTTKTDTVLFIGALLGIIPWLLTKDPTITVIIATLIDTTAYIPTIRKTIKYPKSETLITYIAGIIKHSLSIFALANYNIATYIFPVVPIFMNVIVVLIIISHTFKVQEK